MRRKSKKKKSKKKKILHLQQRKEAFAWNRAGVPSVQPGAGKLVRSGSARPEGEAGVGVLPSAGGRCGFDPWEPAVDTWKRKQTYKSASGIMLFIVIVRLIQSHLLLLFG
jgi:hypothetical protein